MNVQWIKKAAAGAALALTLTFGGGMILGTTAQAQDRYPNDRWQDRDYQRDRDWRDGREYDGDRYRDRSYFEMRRGFQEGMSRGRDDARDGRFFNPNRFMRFGYRSAAFREGFNRGYALGFRQVDRYRRW